MLPAKNINHYTDTTKEKIRNMKYIAEIVETNKEKKITDIGSKNLYIS